MIKRQQVTTSGGIASRWSVRSAWCSAISGPAPIYTLQTVFNPSAPHPIPVSTDNVFGVVSLVLWSVMIIVTVTYVLLAKRADNDGEDGIMALITLLRRWPGQRGRQAALVLAALGIFGASLFFGDSMITPAISVLSADVVAFFGTGAVLLPTSAPVEAPAGDRQRARPACEWSGAT